jgi:hypothetical protein
VLRFRAAAGTYSDQHDATNLRSDRRRKAGADVRGANLALKFVLELCAIAALAYSGARLFDGLGAVVAAVLLPVVAIVVWGRWCAPRASRRLPTPARIPVEMGVFALAVVGLALVGPPVLAIVLGAAMVVNALLLTAFRQWEH